MIYKDAHGRDDANDMPWDREEECVHCGMHHADHNGWECPDEDGDFVHGGTFSSTPSDSRYLTRSMRDSLASVSVHVGSIRPKGAPIRTATPMEKPKADLSDWRTWAHNQPGECPCGIHRQQCTYHRR